jgi:hypothetical protein
LYFSREGTENLRELDLRPGCRIDSLEALSGDGPVVYMADKSRTAYRLTSEDNKCAPLFSIDSGISALAWDAGRNQLWVGADDGLYTWTPSTTRAVRQEVGTFEVKALRPDGSGVVWIGTPKGLWKLSGNRLSKEDLASELNEGRINAVEIAGGQLWIGGHDHGLHRRPLAGGASIPVPFGSKGVASLFRHGNLLFIGSDQGLFQVNVSEAPWNPALKLSHIDPRDPRPGERLQLQWEIGNYDQRTSRELIRQQVEVLDASGKVLASHDVKAGEFQLTIQSPRLGGEYGLRFVLTDLAGREVRAALQDARFVVQDSGSAMSWAVWGVTGGLLLAMAVFFVVRRSKDFGKRVPAAAPASETPRPAAVVEAPAAPAPVDRRAVTPAASPETQAGRRLKVFLCHSSGDKTQVRRICSWLQKIGVDPWLDEDRILPGQDWEREITVAVKESDAVLVCLSKESVSKGGYVHKELRFALDIAERQPEGTIFLIPVKLEECEPPARLYYLHWVNIFGDKGYDRLVAALKVRADGLNIGFAKPGAQHTGGSEI